MVGNENSGRTGGNPNIRNLRKVGPYTEDGKLRVSVNAIKSHVRAKTFSKNSMIVKMMEEAGINFKETERAIEQRSLFQIWLRTFETGEEYTEIKRIDSLIQLIDADMTRRVMTKLDEGEPLDDDDIKLIRLLKETLEVSHKMKYGEKKLNVTATYKDIREMMFDDNPRS